jgi:hypothetical protein
MAAIPAVPWLAPLAIANPAGLLVGGAVVGGFFLGSLLFKHLVEEEERKEEERKEKERQGEEKEIIFFNVQFLRSVVVFASLRSNPPLKLMNVRYIDPPRPRGEG